ncbi:CAP domain-containing protein [Patescibacteria group bacterium]|nr:CAP domain-containing protein [Patescibacteria group bacterium]
MRRFLQSAFLFSGDADHVPQLLRRGAMLGMLGMVLLSFAVANLQALLWQSSQWLVSTILPAIVVELTNEERAVAAAGALRRSSVLDEAAQLKAEHMAAEGYFAHYSPKGVTPWDWFDEVGYVYAHAGENLAIHFSDSGEVVEAWMKSPTHRANIVNGNYTEIGVGTAKGTYQGYDTIFVVQLFGTPALPIARPTPQVAAPLAVVPNVPVVVPEVTIGSTTSTTLAAVVSGAETSASSSVDAIASSSVLVTETASATAMALAYESTPRTPVDIPLPPEPALSVEEYQVEEDMVSLYSGTVATSSGLPVLLQAAPDVSAGATKTAFLSRIATQPNMLLTIVYSVLTTAIAMMLLLSIALAVRSHRPWQIVYSLALLILTGGLITLHLYLTGGAVVV